MLFRSVVMVVFLRQPGVQCLADKLRLSPDEDRRKLFDHAPRIILQSAGYLGVFERPQNAPRPHGASVAAPPMPRLPAGTALGPGSALLVDLVAGEEARHALHGVGRQRAACGEITSAREADGRHPAAGGRSRRAHFEGECGGVGDGLWWAERGRHSAAV